MYKTVNSRWGETTFFAHDEYVGRSLYNYGEYNPDETEKLLELCNGLFLDVGANIGVMSQALLSAGHKVIAFEPQPEVFKLLKKNAPKAECYNVALGSSVGTAKMPKVYYSDKGNFGGLGIGTKSIFGSYDVDVVPLDSFTFDSVSLIKVDVEGYELEFLKGATKTIEKYKPIMVIEDDRPSKSTALRKYIKELGYSIEEHFPALFRKDNFFKNEKNIWAPNNFASSNLICKPC